ncbi:hypothetical protein FGO68_gene11920 [Halteria grandinella]|uniref:Uncharacterized protein n=1 Tax=Halteria grandinella TaxID=5974 RepID=A0A8J8P0K2_HALGN|nr:hypothetical protein FGO68_gene11920 [Halteria grandinella]
MSYDQHTLNYASDGAYADALLSPPSNADFQRTQDLSHAFYEHRDRLYRLQEALEEAYPSLYQRTILQIEDYQQLSIASLNECEQVCRVLIDMEEQLKASQKSVSPIREAAPDAKQYSELINRLEKETSLQANMISKLSLQVDILKRDFNYDQAASKCASTQHYHTEVVSLNGVKSRIEISKLDRELQLLKLQYAKLTKDKCPLTQSLGSFSVNKENLYSVINQQHFSSTQQLTKGKKQHIITGPGIQGKANTRYANKVDQSMVGLPCSGCARLNEQCVSLERRLAESNDRLAEALLSMEVKSRLIVEKDTEITLKEKEISDLRRKQQQVSHSRTDSSTINQSTQFFGVLDDTLARITQKPKQDCSNELRQQIIDLYEKLTGKALSDMDRSPSQLLRDMLYQPHHTPRRHTSPSPTRNSSATDKAAYLSGKLKECERQLAQAQGDLQEKVYLNSKLQEELLNRNHQLAAIETKMREVKEQQSKTETEIKQVKKQCKEEIEKAQKEISDIKRELEGKEREIKEMKNQQLEANSLTRSNETLSKTVEILKLQLDREKKLLEEKVRELTQLSVIEQEHRLEIQDMRDRSVVYEDERARMMHALRNFKDKIASIEKQYAGEIMSKLRALRQEVASKVEGGKLVGQSMDEIVWQSVDQIAADIIGKVGSVVKQRENLQRAVNQIQGEKQQMMTQISSLSMSKSYSAMPTVGTIQGSYSPNKGSETVDYLQAEVAALRQKKDFFQQRVKDLEGFADQVNLFSSDRRKQDNLDLLRRLLSIVKDTASTLCCTDAKNTSSILDKSDINSSSFISLTNDSSMLTNPDAYFASSTDPAKLTEQTEQLLGMVLRTLQIQQLERQQLSEQVKMRELELESAHEQRQYDIEQAVMREEQDKEYILTVENNYQQELLHLRVEKDQVVQQTMEFSKNLQALTMDYDLRVQQVRELESQVSHLQQELSAKESILKDKYSRESDAKLQLTHETAFTQGRHQAEEELSIENSKLRTLIDSLRNELSLKSKRLIEMQFEFEEVSKQKKRVMVEMEEQKERGCREREGQREMQLRLEQLIAEVHFLKNMSKGNSGFRVNDSSHISNTSSSQGASLLI